MGNATTQLELAGDAISACAERLSRVMELVDIAASGRIDVLITGRRDAQYETVARAIHARGPRPEAPFVRVDCAKPRGGDIELELFGTPAPDDAPAAAGPRPSKAVTRTSRLGQAAQGTLLLEHLEALPPAAQARLARLLHGRERNAASDGAPDALDVLVVGVADLEPGARGEDAGLHVDLYEHLAGVRIELPALEIRAEDVPALAARTVADICRRARMPHKELTSLAQILVTSVSRGCSALELRLLLEDVVMRVRGPVIRVEDLLAHVVVDGLLAIYGPVAPLRQARERFERQYIATVIERHRGRIPHAARMLGIERTNLYRKLRHLDVGPAPRRRRAG